jgi:putative copper resistance protein D
VPDLTGPPTLPDLVTQWRPDLGTALLLVAAAGWYLRNRRRLARTGTPWPRSRDAALAAGLLLTFWVTSGFPEARARQLMWMWTAQQLLLLLILPAVLLLAQPPALARAVSGDRSALVRLLDSRAARWAGHPALGPLYVPVVTGLLFFGGIGEWAVRSTAAGWLLHVVLLLVGAVIALPLVDVEDPRSSLAVGATVALGAIELLVDAVPGIVLRLETHLMIPFFGTGRPAWATGALHDQQISGAIMWTVAELLDLPFLVLTVRQWLRVERREAQHIDAELDRAELARAALRPADAPDADGAGLTSRPWWLDHPELRGRYGGGARP